MKLFIRKVGERNNLSREEASEAMRQIMCGEATDAQIAGLLMALRMKGEHPDELLGFVEVMRSMSVHIQPEDPDTIDMCGTGGDGSGTFNISTVAAFVAAGAGATVAKHGNRSVSSSCGSADVMAELGVAIDIPPPKVESCINSIGIGFLFAPAFHPAFRHASRSRTELGIKTVFNLLGPMANPAGVKRQLVGAFSTEAASVMSAVYEALSVKLVYVVNSDDGLDEVSIGKPTTMFEVNGGHTSRKTINPDTFGLSRADPRAISGGTARQNADIAMRVLSGEQIPHRDIVVANAAVGLMAAGIAGSISAGVALAGESIDSGRAMEKLHLLQSYTTQ